jgi:hypothetical protein
VGEHHHKDGGHFGARAVSAQLARDHQLREAYDSDDASAPNGPTLNRLWGSMEALMLLMLESAGC